MSRKGTHNPMYRWYFAKALPDDPYVYLESLRQDAKPLAQRITNDLETNPMLVGTPQLNNNIYVALEGLRLMAADERRKEQEFLRSKGITFNDGTLEMEFLVKINEAITGVDNLKEKLEYNFKLQKANQVKANNQFVHSFSQHMAGYINTALNAAYGTSRNKKNRSAQEKYNDIIRQEIGRELSKTSFFGNLSTDQFATIVGMLQAFIGPQLETLKLVNASGNMIFNNNAAGQIQAAIQKDRKLAALFNHGDQLIELAENFLKTATTTNFNTQSALYANMSTSSATSNQKRATNSSLSRLGLDGKQISTILKNTLQKTAGNYKLKTHVKERKGQGGEIHAALEGLIVDGATDSKNIGNAQAKIDNVLSIMVDEDAQIKVTEEEILKEIKNSNYDNYDIINDNLWDKYTQLDKQLAAKQANLTELKKSFIIHESVKDYQSAIGGTKDAFSGFHGGQEYKMTQYLQDIDKIMQDYGCGLNYAQYNWLESALLNVSDYTLGDKYVTPLRRYLSIFATALLFDDGASMIKTAALGNPFKTLDVLHVFPLNNIYVTSSYIMFALYEELVKFYDQEIQEATSDIINISISYPDFEYKTYLKDLTLQGVLGPIRWDYVKEHIEPQIEISIKFLKNFMDIMQSMYNAIGNNGGGYGGSGGSSRSGGGNGSSSGSKP